MDEENNGPRTEIPQEVDKRRDDRGWVIILLLLLVAALVGALLWFVLRKDGGGGEAESLPQGDFFDPMAETGILPGMSEEEIRAELDRVVAEGMMNIAIAGDIPVVYATGRAKADIVNSAANHYIFKVTITLDDTGETIYESGGIAPGQYIQYIDLDPVPSVGEHVCAVMFDGYTVDEHQLVGSVATQVTLYVE